MQARVSCSKKGVNQLIGSQALNLNVQQGTLHSKIHWQRFFYAIENKSRALVLDSNAPASVRRKLRNEAFETAALLDGTMVTEIGGVTATKCKLFFGDDPKFAKCLGGMGGGWNF